MAYRVRKTEHAGAKNGGGHWGTRAEAKQQSNRKRRQTERLAVKKSTGTESETSAK